MKAIALGPTANENMAWRITSINGDFNVCLSVFQKSLRVNQTYASDENTNGLGNCLVLFILSPYTPCSSQDQ